MAGTRTRLSLLLGIVLVAPGLVLLVGAPAASAAVVGGTGSQSFGYTGAPATFDIPPSSNSPLIVLEGASGGAGQDTGGGTVAGALGGTTSANFDTTVAASLEVVVGGSGGDGSLVASGAGGFNGGAAGSFNAVGGGGGGGASDIRTGDCVATLSCTPSDREAVAGGGGGTAGGDGFEGPGGAGGGLSGEGGTGEDDGTNGGGPGTDSAPGDGGVGGGGDGIDGSPGIGADGGAAAGDGGGGGGGWFGGGGGGESTAGNGSGGGGGSGRSDSPLLFTATTTAGDAAPGDGSVTFYWMTASGTFSPGDPLTVTAHYPASAAGGTVTFGDGTQDVCTNITVAGDGTADCDVPSSPAGFYHLESAYSAAPSGSAALEGIVEDVSYAVDDTPPTQATATGSTAAVQLAPSVRFCFIAHDNESGVSSFDVRYTNAKWNAAPSQLKYPAAWQGTTAGCVTLSGERGHEYCFAARAHNTVGLTGAWSKRRCRAIPLDDRSLGVQSGHWQRKTGSHYFVGSIRTAADAGATLRLVGAHVHRVALVVTTCATCGKLTVTIGKYTFTVNTHSASTKNKVMVVLPTVQREVATVRVRATTDRRVFVDGLAVIQA